MTRPGHYEPAQVRERTDILALIGETVELRHRSGAHMGLCPFHAEKTPSFSVDVKRGLWHCFGCGAGGDVFTFVMRRDGIEFLDAVERLAQRAGLPPSPAAEASVRKTQRDLVAEVTAAAHAAFRKALLGTAGEVARAYLQSRGFTGDDIQRFGLGYAPAADDALARHLLGRQFGPAVLEAANVALFAPDKPVGLVDRFRHRLIVPIHDATGAVVAFGGRTLYRDGKPKYLNTGETPLFHKSDVLYLWHGAAPAIQARGRAIVTEGYFDAMALHRAGLTETVATLGTALSDAHLRALRAITDRLFLLFDGDEAGRTAAAKARERCRSAGVAAVIVPLPEGMDPDTYVQQVGALALDRQMVKAMRAGRVRLRGGAPC